MARFDVFPKYALIEHLLSKMEIIRKQNQDKNNGDF